MQLLTATFDPARRRAPQSVAGPCAVVAVVALALASIGLALDTFGARGIGRGMATAVVHGAFLAVGWILAAGRPASWRPLVRAGSALLLACTASRITTWGILVYLIAPLSVFRDARRGPALRSVGAGVTAGIKPLILGFAAGAFLGIHLLISASLTFGYTVRIDDPAKYLADVAYDIGVNALTAEWLFRGAVFTLCWRRWEFWTAAAVSTAFAVGRYLLDPALPASLEVRAGAVFYMSLLGLSACALRAASGSLLPGYVATIVFFGAYRLLAQ